MRLSEAGEATVVTAVVDIGNVDGSGSAFAGVGVWVKTDMADGDGLAV